MKKVILILSICVAFTACQRELSLLPPAQAEFNPGTLHDFYQKNRSIAETFSISGNTAQFILTAKGTKINFPANAFIREDGTAINGIIKVAVKEITTPAEMILNDMPTMSGGLPIESGGQYCIRVTQNGQAVKLAPSKYLKIELPDLNTSMQGMKVFNGAATPSGAIDWIPNTNPGNLVVGDSTMFSKSSLFCDSLNWINCDKFLNEPTVTFSCLPGNAPSNDSTNVFIHLTNRNTVVKMNWEHGLNYFKSTMVMAIPSTIIGISKKNGQLYASLTVVNVQDGQSILMNFLPYSEQQLKAKLSALR